MKILILLISIALLAFTCGYGAIETVETAQVSYIKKVDWSY